MWPHIHDMTHFAWGRTSYPAMKSGSPGLFENMRVLGHEVRDIRRPAHPRQRRESHEAVRYSAILLPPRYRCLRDTPRYCASAIVASATANFVFPGSSTNFNCGAVLDTNSLYFSYVVLPTGALVAPVSKTQVQFCCAGRWSHANASRSSCSSLNSMLSCVLIFFRFSCSFRFPLLRHAPATFGLSSKYSSGVSSFSGSESIYFAHTRFACIRRFSISNLIVCQLGVFSHLEFSPSCCASPPFYRDAIPVHLPVSPETETFRLHFPAQRSRGFQFFGGFA